MPIPNLFTYRVPFELNEVVQTGVRVVVQFGRKKILTGIIAKIHTEPPRKYEAKYLLEILDVSPSINQKQLDLIEWASNYYMAAQGEVLNVALPSGLKLSSQSFIQLNPDLDDADFEIDEKEDLILKHLKNQFLMSYEEVAQLLNVKNVFKIIKSLVDKKLVFVIEQVKEKYKPKKVKKVRLASKYLDENGLNLLFKKLEKNAKQTDVLLSYMQKVPIQQSSGLNTDGINQSDLLTPRLSKSSLNTLIKHGIMETFTENVSRLPKYTSESTADAIQLSGEQKEASEEILKQFENQDTVLLHGITGSGKTEIYIKLIQQAIENGSQVLYMLPEIALTTQIVKRLLKVFGEQMAIYHSKYSDNERVEVWQNLLGEKYSLVVGVRSSVFLPFSNLGLVIVDEEHEISYKQFDQSPRYHSRDLAIVLAGLHHAKTLLGSATPSFESYHNAKNDKYGHVFLAKRYGEANLPEIQVADLLREKKKKIAKGDFTSVFIKALESTVAGRKQAIVFQNRRGYSPFLTCDDCADVPKCENCSVSLTYHMHANTLRCHYCGYKEPAPRYCKACGSHRIQTVGIGTERIEEELKTFLPGARIERMDLDTTRSKYGYQQIIDGFEEGDIDVLVGTQMVTKGLDFDRVNLVGIVDIDRLIHFPDFRSMERAFQLTTQVSGRAGRRKDAGLVIIQTNDPDQAGMKHLVNQDFVRFYQNEIAERKKYRYPPFHRLIKILLKHRDQHIVEKAAQHATTALREKLGHRILGPKEPLISRIRNKYHMEILVKLEKGNINLGSVKDFIKESVYRTIDNREFKSVVVVFDVDPF